MSDLFKLQGTVEVDTKSATSSLKEIQSEAKNTGESMEETSGKTSKFKDVLGGVSKVVAGAIAGSKVVGFLKGCTSAGTKAMTTTAKMSEVLKSASGATNSEIKSLQTYASQLQKTGVISAGLNKTAMTQLSTFGLQSDSIKKLIPQIDNLAVNQKGKFMLPY